MDENSQIIYALKLHEMVHFEHFIVQRVPGGWNYLYTNSCTFVPLNSEFRFLPPEVTKSEDGLFAALSTPSQVENDKQS